MRGCPAFIPSKHARGQTARELEAREATKAGQTETQNPSVLPREGGTPARGTPACLTPGPTVASAAGVSGDPNDPFSVGCAGAPSRFRGKSPEPSRNGGRRAARKAWGTRVTRRPPVPQPPLPLTS